MVMTLNLEDRFVKIFKVFYNNFSSTDKSTQRNRPVVYFLLFCSVHKRKLLFLINQKMFVSI